MTMCFVLTQEFTTETVRCFGCRNRMGLSSACVTEDGSVLCSSCAERRCLVEGPGGAVELV